MSVACEIEVLWEVVDARLAEIEVMLNSPKVLLSNLMTALEPTLAVAQENAPFHEGTLRENIRIEPVGEQSAAVRTDLPYSWMRERGTEGLDGGVLRPKNASLLHWFDYGGGEWFATEVKQEGTHYMERSYEESRLGIPLFFLANLMAEIT